MAPLKVIGAGVSRSATDSLRIALNKLGYNTLHMRSFLAEDHHPELFIEAFKHPEKDHDWYYLYGDVDAAVDFPTFQFTDKLIEKYPDAKVILTRRDPDSWYKSVYNTVYKYYDVLPENPADYAVRTRDMIQLMFMDGVLQDRRTFKDEPEKMKALYEAHNEWVIKTVPADRLLVLDLREGITWDKVCAFLDKPVPNEPFPFVNSTQSVVEELPEIIAAMSK